MKKMTRQELVDMLNGNGWTLQDALDVVFLRTGAVIKPRNVTKTLDAYGTLSWPLTGLFRLLAAHASVLTENRTYGAQNIALRAEVQILKEKRKHEKTR